MMLSRNPGHRVLGSRVAVPAGDFYAAATVQAMRIDPRGNELVTVKFDDNNKGECPSSEVVGNGFKSIHDIKLHRNQKVYTTHNGREVMGSVEEHCDGCVRVNLVSSNESIYKREEDVRLIESRYSPRLQDHTYDPDYRRIASVNASPSHGKKRPVSESIEVPKQGRARKWSYEPTMDELMAAMVLSNLSNSPHFRQPKSPTIRKGSSPHSLGSSGVGSWGQEAQMSPVKGESMSQPVGASAPQNMSTPPERTQSVIHHTHSIEHSPSSIADPIEVDTSTDMDTSSHYRSVGGVVPPGHSTPAPFQSGSPGVQFQPAQASSPPQNPAFLGKQSLKLESVKEEPNGKDEEKPRVDVGYALPRFYYIPPLIPSVGSGRPDFMVHLQPSGTPPPPLAVPEEHQYRELTQSPRHQADYGVAASSNAHVYVGSPPTAIYIPVLGSSPLNSNLAFGSSAPPAPSPMAAAAQMDMCSTPPRQTAKLGGTSHPMAMPVLNKQAQPINIPGIKGFSWHSSGVPQSFPPKHSLVMQRQPLHRSSSPKSPFSMSPKVPPPGRKIRGDGRKCRKIYGMENRDMWCTACRWKKACQRFPD